MRNEIVALAQQKAAATARRAARPGGARNCSGGSLSLCGRRAVRRTVLLAGAALRVGWRRAHRRRPRLRARAARDCAFWRSGAGRNPLPRPTRRCLRSCRWWRRARPLSARGKPCLRLSSWRSRSGYWRAALPTARNDARDTGSQSRPLLDEIVLVDFPYLVDVLDPDADAMPDHQIGKLLPVDQHHALGDAGDEVVGGAGKV